MFDDDETKVPPFGDESGAFDDSTFVEGDDESTWLDDEGEGGALPPEEGDNKTFLIAVVGLVLVLLLALGMLAAYAVFFVPAKRHARETQIAQVNAQNTAIAQSLTATAIAASWTATPTITPTFTPAPPTPTPTKQATPTQVVASQPTNTPAIDPTAFALTATAIYATNEAIAALTPSPTALAQTGVGEHVGLPGLLALAVLFIAIIFLARRLRRNV